MKTKINFILGEGVYPYKVGGMEIFNSYLIQSLKDRFDISYFATKSLNISGTKLFKCFKLRPVKVLFPLQVFLYLLLHRDIRKVIISYSEGHWINWFLYTHIMTLLKIQYYIVIHHGKKIEQNHQSIYYDFFSKAQKVIAVSEDIKIDYDNFFNLNCEIVYPLVPFFLSGEKKDSIRQKFGIPKDRMLISQIGTLKPMKNPDTILRVLNSLSEEDIDRINPHVVFAGTGTMLDTLKQMSVNLGLIDRVTFLGFVPKEKLCDIYKMTDVYLISSDFEGTSVSLLEAMFNGLPIIASRAPGIVKTVRENIDCLMFSVGSVDELQSQLLKMGTDITLRRNLSVNVYQHYNQYFSYQSVLDAYNRILS